MSLCDEGRKLLEVGQGLTKDFTDHWGRCDECQRDLIYSGKVRATPPIVRVNPKSTDLGAHLPNKLSPRCG